MSEGVRVRAYPVKLEARTEDPTPQTARIYYNTNEKRPKIYVEE